MRCMQRRREESTRVRILARRYAAQKVLQLFGPPSVTRLLQLYAIDYVELGLPLPKWLESPTLRG